MRIFKITGSEARALLRELGAPDLRADVHTVRFAFSDHGVMVKLNEGCWSPSYGAEEQPQPRTTEFVSYMSGGIEHVHAADCTAAKSGARRNGVPLYPTADTLRTVIIGVFSDIWSDEYASEEDAIAAGEVENYAEYIRVCPCATEAGFVNSLS